MGWGEGTWLAVFLLGAFAGGVELLARYRDDPVRTLFNLGSGVYLVINGLAAVAALFLLLRYGSDWVTGASGPDNVKAVLIAGLGSLAVLRASFLKIRTQAGEEVSFGPAFLIESLLKVVDRSVGRGVVQDRSRAIGKLVPRVDFDSKGAELATYALSLLQNTSQEEQAGIQNLINSLKGREDLLGPAKTRLLLLALLTLMGEAGLNTAVNDVAPQA